MEKNPRNNRRALALLCLAVLVLGLFTHLKTSEASNETSQNEVSNFMSGPEFVAALNRYLHLQYQAEFYVREFDRTLDQLLIEKEKFPQRELDPLATDSYVELKRLWPEIVLETDRLAEAYEKLTRSSQARARETLADVHAWFDGLTEADQLQILALLLKLKKSAPGQMRLPSWLEQSNLESLMQEHEAEIAAKSKRAAEQADQADREGRSSDVVYPSPGTNGNFTGNLLGENIFVLTFDDGPGPKSTLRLHKVLTEHSDRINVSGAPASFFVLIEKVHQSPEVLEATRGLGFHINNHSWTHPNFAKLGIKDLRREIVDSTLELQKVLGSSFRFFRCPYGACYAPKVPAARELIAEQGLIHAYWNIDSVDWKNIGRPERTASIVTKEMQVKKRGVILLHDIHESTVDATSLILKWIKDRNEAGARLELMDLEDAVDLVNRAL